VSDTSRYCLDTNIFINAKNGPYGFDIVPSFWKWIDDAVAEGKIYSSVLVCEELCNGNDYLSEWAKERKDSGLFVEPNKIVQETYRKVVEKVLDMYNPVNAQPFLNGADPWVIAHGLADKSVVVSFETLVSQKKALVKIPNVCKNFNVRVINTYSMLRECGAKL
jgi:hypothetical protein